ncbi:MAG: carboxypeptidase-like regulatory domain-containing protein [Candidatus Electryonea clarkiae]|nr:carboxypeptidase-like regulatory domain-containing protein [Candidatus Electryonea clarkiae]MDP8288449.1 carboxypeptidase-like regulatory domain-containing protein [Candidatus Electryonea clarkiae]
MKFKWSAVVLIIMIAIGFCIISCEKKEEDTGTGPVIEAPTEPSNPTPADSSADQDINVTLFWSHSTDPQGDTVKYDLYFGVLADPLLEKSNLIDTTYKPAQMDISTTYYWRIVAHDDDDKETEGLVWSFTTDPEGNTQPGAPTNPSPRDSAGNQLESITLSWICTDPDGDTMTYDVYFGTTYEPEIVSEKQSETSWTLPRLELESQYFWRVIAYDDHNHSTRSPLWNFTTTAQENRAPLAPSNPQPANDAVDQSTFATINWTCTDQDSDPLTYDIYFGTSSPPPLAETGLSQATYVHDELELNTTYYWKITAHDDDSHSTEGEEWSFSTVSITNLAPSTPANPTPADLDTGVDSGRPVVIQWYCSDPENDTILYDIYFGQQSNPPLLVTGCGDTSYFRLSIYAGDYYYWRIIAKDNHGNESIGPVWMFGTTGGSGGNGTVSGTVTDLETSLPLYGVTVRSGNPAATTDANGNYSLTLSAGYHDITASLTGYRSATNGATIVTNQITPLDFQLQPGGGGGGPGTISGRVTDSATGNPLGAVSISSDDGYSTSTDGSGNYSFNVGEGFRTITASLTGYTNATWQVQVDSDGAYNHNFALDPTGGGGGGGGGSPDAFWKGTLQSGWENTVTFDNNTVILSHGELANTVAIPVTGRTAGFLHFTLSFEGDANVHTLAITTLGQYEGGNSFVPLTSEQGRYMLSEPETNARYQVWSNNWRIGERTITAIKLRIGGANEGMRIFLDTPQIRPN